MNWRDLSNATAYEVLGEIAAKQTQAEELDGRLRLLMEEIDALRWAHCDMTRGHDWSGGVELHCGRKVIECIYCGMKRME